MTRGHDFDARQNDACAAQRFEAHHRPNDLLARPVVTERLHGQRFETRRQAKDETIAWLLWYNRTRLHSTLAYVSPMQQDWFAAQAKQANS